jgi:hypothetical protein
MGQSKQHYTLTWQGREVGVTYCPSYSRAVEEIQGYALAHLQVESAGRASLPFTETGYQSRFLPAFEVDSEGGPLAYVQHWLPGGGFTRRPVHDGRSLRLREPQPDRRSSA